MSETTPDIDKYENADWWTVFRATQLCRELKRERDEARMERDEARGELNEALHRISVWHSGQVPNEYKEEAK